MSERANDLRRMLRDGWMAALLAAVIAAGSWLPVAPAPAYSFALTGTMRAASLGGTTLASDGEII